MRDLYLYEDIEPDMSEIYRPKETSKKPVQITEAAVQKDPKVFKKRKIPPKKVNRTYMTRKEPWL